MPQISQLAATYASQLFWLLLTFGITFLVVGLYMYPRIQGTAQARDDKIKGDLAAARDANEEADRAEEAYRVKINEDRAEAQALVAKAKADAAREAEARREEIERELDEKIAAAEAKIAKQKAAAMEGVRAAAAEAAQDIVQQLAGLSVSRENAERQVEAELQNG
jgi:F-type H+-transporting ATPase subunit b